MASDNQVPRLGARRRPVLALAVVVFCLASWLSAPVAADGSAPEDLPNLAALEEVGAETSGLVVDLETGRVLAARGADRALTPASVVKLVTAGLALETWGPAHRFTTRLLRRGSLEQGVLQGDLVVRGAGDASIIDEDVWRMARDLAQAGLARIEGDLVVDESHFGRLACGTLDRCEAWQRSENAYDALLSSTPVNYNTVALKLFPGENAGQAARLALDPFPLPHVRLEGEVATGPGPEEPSLERITEGAIERLLVGGSLPPGEELTLYRSVGNPARHTAALFVAFLAQVGIQVAGSTAVSETPVAGAVPIVEYQGAPLAESLRLMLAYSNNLWADSLAMNLLLDREPESEPDLTAAGRLLAEYLDAAGAGSVFPEPEGAPTPLLLDGSGLEPANRLTARHLVQLLDRLYHRPALFPVLAGAMTVPANGPQRSLPAPGGDADWDERILVKTGGLTEPVSVTTLAGYFRFRDGGWGAFAFLVNGAPGRPILRAEAFSAMRRDLAAHWSR